MSAYEIPITVGILGALRKMIRAVRVTGINEIHLTNDTVGTPYELTHSEINNVTRLRFHGLVAKVYEIGPDGEKKRKQGYWLVTRRAAQFFKGEIELPYSVTVFNDRIISKGERKVRVSEVMGTEPYFETIEDIKYREVQLKNGKIELK